MRLRRSKLDKPGYGRRRSGKGFSYLDADGAPVKDADTLTRIKDLVIPPAWQDVWISPDPRGHIQATGVDAAGRKQYVYHPTWRTTQDEAKFDHALEIAERLVVSVRTVEAHLSHVYSKFGITRRAELATALAPTAVPTLRSPA